MLRSTLKVLVATSILMVFTATAALAVSNAHFVGTPTATRNDDTLTISGKVAGLGQVEVITVTISGDVACINPGTHPPQAANKEALAGGADVPVQHARPDFDLTPNLLPISPSCTPPMTL